MKNTAYKAHRPEMSTPQTGDGSCGRQRCHLGLPEVPTSKGFRKTPRTDMAALVQPTFLFLPTVHHPVNFEAQLPRPKDPLIPWTQPAYDWQAHLWALLSDLATRAHRQTLKSVSPPAKPAHISWTSEDAKGGGHLFSPGAEATGVGVKNFPEDCPVCSLQESETNQASRENLVQEKGPSSPGLWPPHTNPVQRGVHVPGPPITSRSRGVRQEPRSPAAPHPPPRGPRARPRVLTLPGGAGRGEVDPRAAPIR